MKLQKSAIAFVALFAFAFFAAPAFNAQSGGIIKKTQDKVKDQTKTPDDKPNVPKNTGNKTAEKSDSGSDDDMNSRAENAKNLAKAAGMPKPANTDAALNKLLFQAADDTRLIPRKVVVVDKDWFMTNGARNERARQIFAVLGRTLDDGSGTCGKQMVQFEQSWKDDKNSWGLVYVQNIGEITPIACGAIGK